MRNESLYPLRETVRYVDRPTYETWFRGHPSPGDILFVTKGTPGRVCLVPKEVDFCIAQDMVAVRPDAAKVYPAYLFALLRAQATQSAIERMHVGTLIPHFKKGDFHQLLLPVPERSTQVAIGDMYIAISRKIDLNRRMSETLEATARSIFESWFVEFDPVRAKAEGRVPFSTDAESAALFPDAFDDSELGQVPRGWVPRPLSAGVVVTKGRSYTSTDLIPSRNALVTLKSFQRGGGYRDDGLKPYAGVFRPDQVVAAGELVVAFTDVTQAAEVIGRPALVRHDPRYDALVASLDVGIVRPRTTQLPKEYLYFTMRTERFREHTYARANGSTVLHLGPGTVESFVAVWPSEQVAAAFSSRAGTLLARADACLQENRLLAELRDYLLAKLLSGEVRVRDAEKLVGDAA